MISLSSFFLFILKNDMKILFIAGKHEQKNGQYSVSNQNLHKTLRSRKITQSQLDRLYKKAS